MFLQTSFAITFSAVIIATAHCASLQVNADCLDIERDFPKTGGEVLYNSCSGKAAIVSFEQPLLEESCNCPSPKVPEDKIEIPMIATIEDGEMVCPKECTTPIPIHINEYQLKLVLSNSKWEQECMRYCNDGVWYALL